MGIRSAQVYYTAKDAAFKLRFANKTFRFADLQRDFAHFPQNPTVKSVTNSKQ
jgi:hypothetical protein